MRPAITSLMSLVFAAWLSVVATSPGALAAGVNDEGGFFSPGAVEKADAKIDEIRRDCGKGLLIDTVASVPESQQAKYNELGKKEFFVAWARQRAEEARVKGIYILICRKPAHVQVEIDRPTLAKAFTADDRERLLKRMLPLLREKQNDAALLQTVDFVAATLRANVGRRAAVAGGTIRVERAAPHGGGSSWGWIGIIALVALGCWLLMGVMRGVSGMGGGGAGPGYGGGWGGGGGGGFFRLPAWRHVRGGRRFVALRLVLSRRLRRLPRFRKPWRHDADGRCGRRRFQRRHRRRRRFRR